MAETPHPVQTALAWMLVVFGGLWTALTGLCTAAFSGTSIYAFVTNPETTSLADLPSLLAIGAVCVAPGAAMLWIGLHLLRRPPSS